ncbi:hypothetical protein DQ384_01375 [Sphaerisporangium album]|uniref:Uncharacterized protein n=1 Tax=Sphaerisporangium album TaxID=509200 RepID=A0A367FRR9_9ACTN|nr:hypothetical protein [Sphaerisporangium album]RCG33123.1 hypothetical protein DQ384_01375 [Sphaerisporangium album]
MEPYRRDTTAADEPLRDPETGRPLDDRASAADAGDDPRGGYDHTDLNERTGDDLAAHDRAGQGSMDDRDDDGRQLDTAVYDRPGKALDEPRAGGVAGAPDPAHAAAPGTELADPAESRDAADRRPADQDDALRDPDSLPVHEPPLEAEPRHTPDPVLDFVPTGQYAQPPESSDLIVYPVEGEGAGADGLTTGGPEVEPGPVLTRNDHDADHASEDTGAGSEDFQQRWREVQAGFVDDPRDAVQRADELVEEAVATLTARRQGLVDRWKNSDQGDTEQLRLALREYRSLLDELVGLSYTTAGHGGSPARHEAR